MKKYNHVFHPSILREYDIRGIINQTLFEKDAFMIGYFFGLICKEKNRNKTTTIVQSFPWTSTYTRGHTYAYM